MVREDILEGLKSAVARGESLKQAMISFFNAGYKREEIQEAARAISEQQLTQGIVQPQVQQQVQNPPQGVQQPVTQQQTPKGSQGFLPGKPKQKVSQYGKKKPGSTLIIVLVIFLVLLVGILAAIFIFRNQITDFLSGLI